MTPRIAVVGSLNRDVTVPVARLPRPGDTVVAVAHAVPGFGGKGANQAAAAAAYLGERSMVAMIGCIGDDEDGRAIIADLNDVGVNTGEIRTVTGHRTGAATIPVDPNGENFVIVDPGANAKLLPADVRAAAASSDVLLTQLEIPLDVVRAAVRAARGTVILNPAPWADVRDLADGVDVLVPNQAELAYLIGEEPAADIDGAMRQARRLDMRGTVVVTMGGQGALVVGPRGSAEHLPAPEVTVVDTTGAGDCFCGVLAAELAEGRQIRDAARIAVMAAAVSVGAVGARGRLPHRDEVMGWNGREVAGNNAPEAARLME